MPTHFIQPLSYTCTFLSRRQNIAEFIIINFMSAKVQFTSAKNKFFISRIVAVKWFPCCINGFVFSEQHSSSLAKAAEYAACLFWGSWTMQSLSWTLLWHTVFIPDVCIGELTSDEKSGFLFNSRKLAKKPIICDSFSHLFSQDREDWSPAMLETTLGTASSQDVACTFISSSWSGETLA